VHVTSDTIQGRGEELRRCERFLDEGGRVLILEGDAGIGKTTVWLEALELAEARGRRVLHARPAESEARLSYAALADLLGNAFDGARPALPEPQAHALDVALLRAVGPSVDARTIATGLCSAVDALATESPLVLALDDVQWLDRASARALGFLARRLPSGAQLLLTRRSGPDDPLGLDRLGADVERVVLGPLSVASLHHLLRDRLGLNLPRPTLTRIHAVSGGNPFYAQEIARALEGWSPSLGAALPVPGGVRAVVGRRIARLPAPTRDALLLAAALARPTTALVPADALDAAEEAGVARVAGDRIEFAHPLVASTVYASATAAARRAAHERLAESVAELEERARHTALAATEPDESVAALLDAAAAHARARGAPDEAAELQERAAQTTPPSAPAAAQRRLVAAAEHFFHAGDPRRAQALLERALPEIADRGVRSECLRLLGELRFSESSFPAAIELLEQALLDVDTPRTALALRLDLAYAHLSVQHRGEAGSHARAAVALAEGLGVDGLLAEALATDAMVSYLGGSGIDRAKVDRAVALEDPVRHVRLMMRPSSIAAMLAVSDCRLAEGVERLDAVCSAASARGEESELPLLLAYLAAAEWRRGDFDRATAVADEIVRIAVQTGNEPAHAIGLTHRAMSAAFRGDTQTARASFAEAGELMARTGWALGGAYVRMGRGFLELSVGDAAAAAEVLAPLTDAVVGGEWFDPELALFVPDAVEAALLLGRLDAAAGLVEALERPHRGASPWTHAEAHRCRALVLADSGDAAGALLSAHAASRLAGELEQPFLLGRVLLTEGRILRRLRRKAAARTALEDALSIFERLGTPLWAAHARDELERVGRRTSEPDELSETERRIAELAASGLTNREIAQRAFVSPKTVEANLARVYRKLGIHSRAELGARMANT
jgi:ATP/maltotriose-dependent transcriptional regulator MalT